MASLHPYTFNSTGRIRADNVDKTQQNMMSSKYNNYLLTSYFSENKSDDYVNFATSQPGITFKGSSGIGFGASNIDIDSALTIKTDNERSLEKLSLQQRPFLTVPYLGRGSCDTTLESQLKQGDVITNKKSVSTISEQSFINNQMYPLMDSIKDTITNPKFLVQEAALDGWIRGGSATRELSNHLPNNKSF
jgi:hypothetical protein